MIEGDGTLKRQQPEPPPRPETPEQRHAQEFWNRVIESVPVIAAGVGRGHSPELQPTGTAEAFGLTARVAARRDGQATPGAGGGSADDSSTRAAGASVWRAVIESQPPLPAAVASQTRSQGRTSGS